MGLYTLALFMGLVAGLRSMTAPAVVAWAARLGWLDLEETPLAFLGSTVTALVFTALALGEFVTDQLPRTPSRKIPVQFVGRVVSGALCGAAIGASRHALLSGLAAGIVGAVLGTLGGAEVRARLAKSFGSDRPAGVLEDVIAVALALTIGIFASRVA